MAVNKVIYDGETLVDLTEDTVTPETLAEGATAHAANGEQIVGTFHAVGIANIYQKTASVVDGGENVLVVEQTDGTLTNFVVRNGNTGKDGADGDTPVKGVDYYTPEDKAELSEYIADELAKRGQLKPEFANDIDGCTDESKLYVLPDGLIYGYIQTVTEGETVPNYTNLLDDPNAYVKNGYRYSHSSAAFKAQASDCAIVVPIPTVSECVIRVRGATMNGCNYPGSIYFDTNNATFGVVVPDSNQVTHGDDENGDAKISILKMPSTAYSYIVFHVAHVTNVDALIVTVNEEIVDVTTPGGIEYQWASTGHAFVPADYEDRIVDLEAGLADAKSDIETLQEKVSGVSISTNATTAFSVPAYCPVPQLPADGSEGADFDYKTVTTQDAHDFMDALANKYTSYLYKQVMGKDASGEFDHNRYILSKAYWRAWQKENYPRMFAWLNGSTLIYSASVSPRVGDTMYSTPYIGTAYSTVTAVNSAAKTASTRTVNGLVFTRHESGDVEPTIAYTKPPRYPGDFATATVYNSSYVTLTTVSTVGSDYIIGADGIKYIRYPFEDRRQDKTKPLSVFILSNEHGLNGDALIPSFAVMRMAKDLCKNTENTFLRWLKENCTLTMIPVGNPWGYARYLVNNGSGYYTSTGVNINRNYDTPGWSTSDTNYGDRETFGAYPGSEIETQHIMDTMRLCKPAVGISMHGLGLPPEYADLPDNGYFIYQGQGFDSTRVHKIAETLYSSYGMGPGTSIDYAQHYEMCGKSPAYIQYTGAVGGLTETICWEAGTSNEYTARAMEQAYTQLLLFLQTWCEEALTT